METLEQGYELAAAVLSAPVSFVEWTVLKVESRATPNPRDSTDWSPLAVSLKSASANYQLDTTQPIVDERYIYAFSRSLWSSNPPTLVEELKLDANGIIYAAQMPPRRFPDTVDSKNPPLPETRDWKKVGTTIRFVRRLRGVQMAHFFFASSIQLSRHFVDELKASVVSWVPETLFDDLAYLPAPPDPAGVSPSTFGEWDNNVVTGHGAGALQVPVVNPLTIALNLHRLATTAEDDLCDYSTSREGQSEEKSKLVRKRQQKVLLARLVKMVLDSYAKDNHPKADITQNVDKFIREYEEQLDYRIVQMETWWKYLANWYRSAPIKFLSRVHYQFPNENRWKFFLPMMSCLLDANCSEAGRALLADLVKHPDNWFRYAVLPPLQKESEEDPAAEIYQVPRKYFLAVLEVFKEAALHIDHSTASMFKILAAYSKHAFVRFLIDGAEMDPDPLIAAEKFSASLKPLKLDVGTGDEIVEEWLEIAEHHAHAKAVPVLKVATVVEIIDLILSFRQFLIDPSAARAVTVVRSSADTAALLLEFAHGTRGKFLAKLLGWRWGFIAVSAVIEAAFSAKDMMEAGDKHDNAGSIAGLMTFTGAAVTFVGAMDLAGAVLTETPLFFVGLILMGLGTLLGFLKDDPMDTFLKFCFFGPENYIRSEIVEGLGELRKDDYLQQLKILVNLLCRFDVEYPRYDEDGRSPKIKMSTVLPGSQLLVDYHDRWFFSQDWFAQQGIQRTADSGQTDLPSQTLSFGKGAISLNEDREFPLLLSKAPTFEPGSIPEEGYAFASSFTAQLRISSGGLELLVPPKPAYFSFSWPEQKDNRFQILQP